MENKQALEYSEVCTTFRHYSSLRFASLTVFFVVLAGLITMTFGTNFPKQSSTLQDIGALGGLAITFVFWRFEERTISFMAHLRARATELEQALGYRHLSGLPRAKTPLHRVIFASRLLYAAVAIFWIYAIVSL